MAIVAAAAAASSGVGIGTASLRRQPTEVAFTVAVTLALVGIALCLLAFVLTLLLQQRPGLSGTGARRPRRRHYLVTLGAIAVFVAIAELLAHTAHRREPHLAGAGARAPTRLGHHHGSLLHLVPSASYATIGVVVLVLVVVFVLPLVHRLFMAPRHFEALGRPEPLSYPVGERDLAGLASALEKSEIADPHTEPDPRRAVVKAWLSMTEAAKAAGTPRRPSETPTEYLSRLLCLIGVAALPASRLTSIFELARYSTAPVTEAIRSDAMAALQEVKAVLRTGAEGALAP